MRLVKAFFYTILFFVFTVTFGCVQKKAAFTPDFSTPETAFNTSFYAVKNKMYELVIDSMSEDYKKNFGPDRQTQLETLRTGGAKVNYHPNWERKIVKVKYGPFAEGYDARVIYDEYKGKEPIFLKATMPMVKENNQWRIALVKEPPPTPEQIAQAEETKKIIKTGVVLDEERNVWVPADEASQKK